MALLTRWRLNVALQLAGWGLTAAKALAFWVLVYVVLRRQGEQPPEVWLLYGGAVLLALVDWLLYDVLDIDGDGAEGDGGMP